jgi:hypothetical protein
MLQRAELQVSHVYNLLPDVETADADLTQLGRASLLERLGDVIRAHDLCSKFGIRLLHRHNSISDTEVMVEREEHSAALGHCLTTMAADAPQVSDAPLPNSWKLHDGAYVPLEWSADAEVTSVVDPVGRHGEFFSDFAAVLSEHECAGILGPCVIARDFARRHRPSPSSIFIETCEDARRANVVRFDDPERYASQKLIQTTWVVSSRSAETDCNPDCIPSGCNPVSACVVGSNGHQSETAHVKGNHAVVHG